MKSGWEGLVSLWQSLVFVLPEYSLVTSSMYYSGLFVAFVCGIIMTMMVCAIGMFLLWRGSHVKMIKRIEMKNSSNAEINNTFHSHMDGLLPRVAKETACQGWIQFTHRPLTRSYGVSFIASQTSPKRSFSEPGSRSFIYQEFQPRNKSKRKSVVKQTFEGSLSVLSRVYKTLHSPTSDPSSWMEEPVSKTVFAVMKENELKMYSTDDMIQDPLLVVPLSKYSVRLWPRGVPEYDLFLRDHPIQLRLLKGNQEDLVEEYYIYAPTASEKEDWFLSLRRASVQSYDSCCHLAHTPGNDKHASCMEKLIHTIKAGSLDTAATAWMNAIMGRAFVGFQANPHIKEYLMTRLSRRAKQQVLPTFLSDFRIQDIHVGDSVPIVSHPELLDIASDGSLSVKMNIEYSGAAKVELSFTTTLSVPTVSSLDYFKLKPLSFPLVVSVSIRSFSAQVMIKMKPFFESNRIWFGFYPDPEIKLDIEPIISNKGMTLDIVNQFIEERIKQELSEFWVLPNMDDIPFWSSEGKGGLFCCTNEPNSYSTQSSPTLDHPSEPVSSTCALDENQEEDFSVDEVMNMVEEATLDPTDETSPIGTPADVSPSNSLSSTLPMPAPISLPVLLPSPTSISHTLPCATTPIASPPALTSPSPSYVASALQYISKAAVTYGLDHHAKSIIHKAQEYGLDKRVESVYSRAKHYVVRDPHPSFEQEMLERSDSSILQPPTFHVDDTQEIRRVAEFNSVEDACKKENRVYDVFTECEPPSDTTIMTSGTVSTTTTPAVVSSSSPFSLLSFVPYQHVLTHAIQDAMDYYQHPGPKLRVMNPTLEEPMAANDHVPDLFQTSSLESSPFGSPERT